MLNNLPSFMKLMMQSGMKILSRSKEQKKFSSFPNERQCPKCKEIKSLTEENFQIVKSFSEGYSFYCNECNNSMRKVGK